MIMRKYITNKFNSVFLPYEEGMIEWLNENYPHSKYVVVEVI
jgi:hypothetical protein|tara:strand:+ start:120 stop:245 length:126 start_codon:yes stop_codon:yes gene_type:complete